jgi:hypothetical protein
MKEPAQVFTYTARRGAYITTVCTLAFLFLTDVGLLVFLIFLFIHTTVLKLVLLALVAALYFSAIGLWLLPLWTKHRLTETHLSLHYGRALKVNIPRTAIAAAQPVRERLTMLEPLAARYDAKKGRVVAASSDQGQVLLRLDKPHALKVGRSTVLGQQGLTHGINLWFSSPGLTSFLPVRFPCFWIIMGRTLQSWSWFVSLLIESTYFAASSLCCRGVCAILLSHEALLFLRYQSQQ